jgi:FkbM family methyltransferase
MSLGKRFSAKAKDAVLSILYAANLRSRVPDARLRAEELLRNEESWQRAYDLLGDEYSRQLLVQLVAFRILGSRHIRLATNTDEYWRKHAEVMAFAVPGHNPSNRGPNRVQDYVVPLNGNKIRLTCHPLHVLNTFLLEQYACARLVPPAVAMPGDVVIDGGACWGDSALYFATKIGSNGRVFSFEFDDSNFQLLEENLQRNKSLAARICVLKRPLWSTTGKRVGVLAAGPSARVSGDEADCSHATISIDDFVAERKLDRLDFIKMDIEGAEFAALQGATESLRKFRPKLAISAYHSLDDLHRLLLYLHRLNLGYVFALDHYTIHSEETVLFATVPEVMAKQ